jgi:hypothetical protein
MRLKLGLTPALALALAASVHGQLDPVTYQPWTVPSDKSPYPVAVYRVGGVDRTLNLTPEQVNRLNQLTDQTQAAYRERYAALRDVPEADRWARQQELNRQYYAEWMKGARGVFKDDQYTRYQQLNYQYGGFTVLSDPDLQKRLNLTPEQQKALREQIDWSTGQLSDINRMGPTDFEKASRAYGTYRTEYDQRFNRLLTPEQQRTWREMTGEPYTFRPLAPNPGR